MRVLSSLVALTLLSFAAIASDIHSNIVERARSDRDVEVLLQARAVTRDLSGTFWVYHGVSGVESERAAAGVTALRADGTTRTYLASDILPSGSVMNGMVGQVFAVTPLTTRGFYAATAGWLDPDHRTHNAIVFFRENANGTIANVSVIPAASARAIAAGPHDTVVVAAVDLLQNGDLKLATFVDANGNVLGGFGPFTAESRATASTRISSVRFHQIDGSAIAILDGAEQRVHGLRVHAPAECAIERITASGKPRPAMRAPDTKPFGYETLWSVSIAKTDIANAEITSILGFSANAAGAITVARGVVIDDEPRTMVTRYDKAPRSWTSSHFWHTALIDDSGVRGIVSTGSVWEERVELTN